MKRIPARFILVAIRSENLATFTTSIIVDSSGGGVILLIESGYHDGREE
jgi:hypothetical protein